MSITTRHRRGPMGFNQRAMGVVAVALGFALLASACAPMSGAGRIPLDPTPRTTITATAIPIPTPTPTVDKAVDITPESAESLLIPAGACGSAATIGWDQPHPIQLSGGGGEYYDDDGRGAGIGTSTLVGAVDMNADGEREAVLLLDCTGTPFVDCCAGSMSTMHTVVVLDLTGTHPRLIAEPLFGSNMEDVAGAEPREIVEAALIGTQIMIREVLVYPEDPYDAGVSAEEGWLKYELVSGTWQRVDE